jgi:hypothetical protein
MWHNALKHRYGYTKNLLSLKKIKLSKKIQLFPLVNSPSYTVFETLVLTKEQNTTQGEHMNGVLPWFVRWARRAGT